MDSVGKFREIAKKLGDLYEKKNAAYGNSFGETYGKLGIVSAVTRISDKYNRLCNLVKHPEIDDIEESVSDTLGDMACYCIMTMMEMEKENERPKEEEEQEVSGNSYAEKNYFRFIALEDSEIVLSEIVAGKHAYPFNIVYCLGEMFPWKELPVNERVVLKKGETMVLRGCNPIGLDGYTFGLSTGKLKCEGNIMSLLDMFKFEYTEKMPANSCFFCLFYKCEALYDASGLILPNIELSEYCYSLMFKDCTNLMAAPELPATTLADGCYCEMFSGCASMTTAPKLPATTLADNCYNAMFLACTSLTTAPELPATELADDCYNSMFEACTSLTTAPKLPATELANCCYGYMFEACNSLTTAPELPATTLAENCYSGMFYDCTSLITAPELPATELANCCYGNMFEGCTSLTTAPSILPATTLADGCYVGMFQACKGLTAAPKLPATTLAEYCYNCMFSNCSSLITAPELPATTLSENCYNGMFDGCTSLKTAPELPATTLADWCYQYMFYGCTSLNQITMLATDISAFNCLYNWVKGVSPTGTFIKHPDMDSLPIGNTGIPQGWDVSQ